MAYTENKLPSGLETITTMEATDKLVVGDNSDAGRVKAITVDNFGATATEINTGTDDTKFVTPASLSGSNYYRAGGTDVAVADGGTNQSSYTKGDILVAASATVLNKLAVGTDGQALVAASSATNGVEWATGNTKPTVRVYTANDTWTKPAGLKYVTVEVQAGGGGGGGTTNTYSGCGGGGGGGYSRKTIAAASLGATEAVTVGAAGAAGSSAGGTGGTGGNSSFGAHATANGGAGGVGTDFQQINNGGAGGTAASGDINIPGGAGSYGAAASAPSTASLTVGGPGGASVLGSGGKGVCAVNSNTTAGVAGGVYGGGGSGAANHDNGADTAGGAGAAGVVIVYEY